VTDILETYFATAMQRLGVKPGSSKILLGISSGVDSTVLAHMLYKAGFKVGFAHVNYGLRPGENENELKSLHALSKKFNFPLHLMRAKTKNVTQEKKMSVQMAAREIRYNFFDEIRLKEEYTHVATAHHANDNLENLFIYLLRNNISTAFCGIPEQNDHIIRPLLSVEREQILRYAMENKITWNEDSSNSDDYYMRNQFRHAIIPGLCHFYPQVFDDFYSLSQAFSAFQNHRIGGYVNALETFCNNHLHSIEFISFKAVELPQSDAILNYYFKQLGIDLHTIQKLLKSRRTGAVYKGKMAMVKIERNGWRIEYKNILLADNIKISSYNLPLEINFGDYQVRVKIDNSPAVINAQNTWYFDRDEIQFPLTIRNYVQGDKMSVLGLKGHKKLSDVLINAKIENSDKIKLPVLTDNNGILGLIPLKRSNECKITATTKSCIVVNWSKKGRI
jgi:tRNA(Ile)-lysidine synthase